MSRPSHSSYPQEIPTFVECVIRYRKWVADERDQLWPIFSNRRAMAAGDQHSPM